jgi:hypothetical protein
MLLLLVLLPLLLFPRIPNTFHLPLVCAPGGYMEYQGYDISAAQVLIPKLQQLLHAFRTGGFPVYHTREGTSSSNTQASNWRDY